MSSSLFDQTIRPGDIKPFGWSVEGGVVDMIIHEDPIMAMLPFGDIQSIAEKKFEQDELKLYSWNQHLLPEERVGSGNQKPKIPKYNIDLGDWKQLYLAD